MVSIFPLKSLNALKTWIYSWLYKCSQSYFSRLGFSFLLIAQSAGAVEYTDCFSAEG